MGLSQQFSARPEDEELSLALGQVVLAYSDLVQHTELWIGVLLIGFGQTTANVLLASMPDSGKFDALCALIGDVLATENDAEQRIKTLRKSLKDSESSRNRILHSRYLSKNLFGTGQRSWVEKLQRMKRPGDALRSQRITPSDVAAEAERIRMANSELFDLAFEAVRIAEPWRNKQGNGWTQ